LFAVRARALHRKGCEYGTTDTGLSAAGL